MCNKQWFNYAISSTTQSAQITPANYVAVGPYPGPGFCSLATRVCLIYTYTSSGFDALPSPFPCGAPGISAKLQAYIAVIVTGPVANQPGAGKKYIYVRGT